MRIIHKYINIIAYLMIVCMAFVDCGMLVKVLSNDNLTVVYEQHDMQYMGADGYFGGNNSNKESKEEEDFEIPRTKMVLNILEIVPNKAMGVIGYSVAGCEPVYDEDDAVMREACMDAMVNKTPGTDNGNDQNQVLNGDVDTLSSKMQEGGVHRAFTLESGQKYDGYYKYVGANKGVYAIALTNPSDETSYDIDKDNYKAVMVSKYYAGTRSNTGKFDYIWVYSSVTSETTPNDLSTIYVKDHKKIKYINNDKFLRDSYGLSESALSDWKKDHKVVIRVKAPTDLTFDDIEWADVIVVNSGSNMDYYNNALNIYNRTHGTSYPKGNFSKTNDFPSFEHTIRIYERVVIREDVAFVGSKNCVSGSTFDTNLRKLMCMLFYINNNNISNWSGSGRDIFMDFMKRYVDEPGNHTTYDPADGNMKTYYEIRQRDSKFIAPSLRGQSSGFMHQTHPLVRTNDEAIYGSHLDWLGNIIADKGGKVNNRRSAKRDDTDMYLRDGNRLGLDINASYDAKKNYGESVKEFYYSPIDNQFGVSDIIPWSASEREKRECTEFKDEYAPYRWRMPLYESKSSTTDYVYIDDNGNFIRDDKYSGEWYGIDALTNNGQVWEYKVVKWDRLNQETWPWNVVEGGCLKEWWFGDGSTWVPGNSRGKHIHLYYDYYSYGPYRAVNNPQSGTYRNQSIEDENALFKGNLIKDAVDNRTVLRENDPNRKVDSDDKDKVYYYVSTNIRNGDGYNKKETGNANKVIYINDYENDDDVDIPLEFDIKASDKITKIELLRKTSGSYSVLKTYTADISNNIETCAIGSKINFSNGLSLKKIQNVDEEGNQVTTGPSSDPKNVYAFEGKIILAHDYFKTGANNTFAIRAEIEPMEGTLKSATDDITIAVRDFFELN